MLGRIVGEGGRGFGVDLDEHPSVNLAKVTTSSRSMVSSVGCGGVPPLHLPEAVLVVVVVVAVGGVGGGEQQWWWWWW